MASKWPHFVRARRVGICFRVPLTVCYSLLVQNASSFTIEQCHWDGIYKVILVVQSKAGQSEEADERIKLGKGYADYYYEGPESGTR